MKAVAERVVASGTHSEARLEDVAADLKQGLYREIVREETMSERSPAHRKPLVGLELAKRNWPSAAAAAAAVAGVAVG